MTYETLGDWCKWLEKNFSPEIMIPTLPVIIRLDGNNFHNWTKGLNRPFDQGLVNLMGDTCMYLVQETNAVVGYTQSDEITLILYSGDKRSAIYNDGKKQKILSKLTSKTVNYFNMRSKFYNIPAHSKLADFDCRIYQTPTLNDATLQLLWREQDATRNSILSLAQSMFSHKEMQNLQTDMLQDKMMLERGVNWNDLHSRLKRGTYVKRQLVNKPFSTDEIVNLPEGHNARKNPNLVITRHIVNVIEYPIMSKIGNRVEVIFQDAEPISHEKTRLIMEKAIAAFQVDNDAMALYTLVEDISAILEEYGFSLETDDNEHDGFDVVTLKMDKEKVLPRKSALRPCDCKDESDCMKLNTNGIGFNSDNILLKPNSVVLTMGHTALTIPMKTFKRFAEWYLEEQEVKPYNVLSNDTTTD